MTNANLPDVVIPTSAIRVSAPFPPPDDPDRDDGDGAIDWRRIRSAIVRYKWLVLAVTLVGTAAGIGATRLISPVYAAQAKIWIDVEGRRDPGRGPTPIRARRLLDPESWIDLLESYVVLDQVVRDQRLYLQPHSPADAAPLHGLRVAGEFRPGTYRFTLLAPGDTYTLASDDGVILERGQFGDSVGRALGLQWVPGRVGLTIGHSVDFTLSTLRDAATQLSQDLDARMDLDGNFMRIELRGAQPARITAIVNAVAARFAQVEADLKRQKVTELTRILGDQVQQSQQNLRAAEDALQRYREQTITLPNERPTLSAPVTGSASAGPLSTAGGVASASGVERLTRDPVGAGFFDLQAARDQARRDRAALTRLLDDSPDVGLTADALAPIGAVKDDENLRSALKELTAKRTELRALQYKYEDQYPPIQRLLEEIRTLEQQTIPGMVRSLVQQLATREGELGRRLDADSRSLRKIPERAITEARLRREATLSENLYASLEQQYEEARLAEASTVPDVRLLDGAVEPQRPVKNTAPRLIFLGSLGSLALAIMAAVLIDRMDPRVRYPEQVSREMGLTILGSVPYLRSPTRGAHDGKGRSRDFEDAAVTVEALRGVCLNLSYAHGAAMPMLLTLTSPGPGDGKSFLVSNLGRTFGEAGHRVLLIDGDIRRGILHRRLGGQRRPGLSNYLRGEVPVEQIVQATPYPSLSLISSGSRASDAPDLLGSRAMGRLTAALRTQFDVILIDSPPLCAGVDPLILGTLTGNLALVIRTGYSHREMAAAKLEVLRRLPLRLLGAILNAVPAGQSYGYYSYFLPGYEAVEEEHRVGGAGRQIVL